MSVIKVIKLIVTNPYLFVQKVYAKLMRLYRLYGQKDEFTIEVTRWFKDKGDETLRLDYPLLNESSTVFDLGGCQGDFADKIFQKYGCSVYLFEPHPFFYNACVERFKGNEKIVPLNIGISDVEGSFEMSDDMDGSSFFKKSKKEISTINCKIREFFKVVDELGIKHINLMKLNIEGGEYPLLEHIIKRNKLTYIDEYQIQFHNFVDDAKHRRSFIIDSLAKTHTRTWCYTFVWENWRIK